MAGRPGLDRVLALLWPRLTVAAPECGLYGQQSAGLQVFGLTVPSAVGLKSGLTQFIPSPTLWIFRMVAKWINCCEQSLRI